MGVIYYLVDDEHREAYALGKGSWADIFARGEVAARQEDAKRIVNAIPDMFLDASYAGLVVAEVVFFLVHSRWRARFVNDTNDELDREQKYKVVGSRYKDDENIGRPLRDPAFWEDEPN